LAAYYYFNHNLSYGPGFLGWPSNVYLNEKRYSSLLNKLEKFHNENLNVYLGDFVEILPKYRNDFLYLDPPYYIGPDSKMFKGIYPMRNIPIHHNNFKHEVLRDLLKQHKGGFILSYNDCPTIREWYKDYEQYFPKWQYSMGQGEKRIGKYRNERNQTSHVKESHEILIYCGVNSCQKTYSIIDNCRLSGTPLRLHPFTFHVSCFTLFLKNFSGKLPTAPLSRLPYLLVASRTGK